MIGSILSIISTVLKLANSYFNWKEKKDAENTGRIKEQKQHLEQANKELRKVIVTRRRARREFKCNGLSNNYKYYRKK